MFGANSIYFIVLASTSFTASTSYQNVGSDNGGYISNVIPDSGDSSYNYNNFNQYNNDYNNQYQYQYQNYNYQPQQQPQTTTFRPFISIFKTASKFFTKPKSSGSGFKFGTLYL